MGKACGRRVGGGGTRRRQRLRLTAPYKLSERDTQRETRAHTDVDRQVEMERTHGRQTGRYVLSESCVEEGVTGCGAHLRRVHSFSLPADDKLFMRSYPLLIFNALAKLIGIVRTRPTLPSAVQLHPAVASKEPTSKHAHRARGQQAAPQPQRPADRYQPTPPLPNHTRFAPHPDCHRPLPPPTGGDPQHLQEHRQQEPLSPSRR